jgi:hypothetical protein
MMKTLNIRLALTVAAAVAWLSCATAFAEPITYNIVNYPLDQNEWTLSGSITTDGTMGNETLGSLNAANIIAWSYTITNPSLPGDNVGGV